MKSLEELMDEAFDLSLDLVYATLTPDGNCFFPRGTRGYPDIPATEAEITTIAAWADGLYHTYIKNHMNGRTSLQAMIDFDIAKFESEVEKDITMMQKILKKTGAPHVMTYQEMQMWGYRGRWAGMFPMLTYPGITPYTAV